MGGGGKGDQGGGGGGPPYEPGADLRLDFLFEYLQRSLKIKLDKWMKLMTSEDHRANLLEFLDNGEIPVRYHLRTKSLYTFYGAQ